MSELVTTHNNYVTSNSIILTFDNISSSDLSAKMGPRTDIPGWVVSTNYSCILYLRFRGPLLALTKTLGMSLLISCSRSLFFLLSAIQCASFLSPALLDFCTGVLRSSAMNVMTFERIASHLSSLGLTRFLPSCPALMLARCSSVLVLPSCPALMLARCSSVLVLHMLARCSSVLVLPRFPFPPV